MSSSKNSLKKVAYEEMIRNSSLIALASEKEIKYSITKVTRGNNSSTTNNKFSFKNGKVPAKTWNNNPSGYNRFHDDNYGSAVICSYINDLDLHLAVIDLDIPKNDSDISIEDLFNASRDWVSKTHTKVTPSGGYHIYLLSKNKPELKQPPFNMDYQTNTGNSQGKYVVTNYRYEIDIEGNKINLDNYYKENGKIDIRNLNFSKEFYTHCDDSPDDILVVNSSDDVLTDIITNLKEQGLYKPNNSLALKNKSLNNKFRNDLVAIVRPYVKEGQRNRIALALSGYLHKRKVSLLEAEKIFNSVFADDEEIEQRINLLKATFKKSRSEVAGLRTIREIFSPSDADKIKELVKNKSENQDMTKSDLDNSIIDINEKISYYLDKSHSVSGKMIIKSLEKENILYFEAETMKYYAKKADKRDIIEIDYKFVMNHCNMIFGFNEISKKQCKNCLDNITRFIEKDHNLLEFSNGSLKITNDSLEFNEGVFSTNKIPKVKLPFRWNPNANGREIQQTVLKTLACDKEGFEDNVNTFLKCVGHSFMSTIEKPIFPILLGKPGTRKSTLLTMLKRCLSFSEISIPDIINDDRFTLYPGLGKDINIDDDLQSSIWKGIGKLNTFISGNGGYTEVKSENERLSFTTYNTPKLWGASNALPPVIGDGFERRLILILAENILPTTKVKDNFQTDILNGIHDEGLEWLVYTSITKYMEVRNKPLIDDTTKNAMLEEYKSKSDPLKKCIDSIFLYNYTDSNDKKLSVRVINNQVKKWHIFALKNGLIYDEHRTPSTTNIKNAMNRVGYSQSTRRVYKDGKETTEKCYTDIIINPEWEKTSQAFFKNLNQ